MKVEAFLDILYCLRCGLLVGNNSFSTSGLCRRRRLAIRPAINPVYVGADLGTEAVTENLGNFLAALRMRPLSDGELHHDDRGVDPHILQAVRYY